MSVSLSVGVQKAKKLRYYGCCHPCIILCYLCRLYSVPVNILDDYHDSVWTTCASLSTVAWPEKQKQVIFSFSKLLRELLGQRSEVDCPSLIGKWLGHRSEVDGSSLICEWLGHRSEVDASSLIGEWLGQRSEVDGSFLMGEW